MNTINFKKIPVLIISFFILICVINSICPIVDTIPVNSMKNMKVIPSGEIVGIKMYVGGVLVVGYSDVIGIDNKVYKPYEDTKIAVGDRIVRIEDNNIESIEDLKNNIIMYEDKKVEIEYIKNNEKVIEYIRPILSKEDNRYHIGLWVKDGAVGLGTLSFYNMETTKYASLGHAVIDSDTGEKIDNKHGEIVETDILEIVKGNNLIPGEVKGIFSNNILGSIVVNTNTGIYGYMNYEASLNKYDNGISVAYPHEIKKDNAKLVSSISGTLEEYDVEIEKVSKIVNINNKDLIIKIVDKKLLELTGGIVQGMSGSPIIQNGKLIGVLTHVFVNDSTKGYGIYAETMVRQLNNI